MKILHKKTACENKNNLYIFSKNGTECLTLEGIVAEKYISAEEAAQYLGVTRRTLYTWVKERKIRYFQPGANKRYRFLKEDLDAFMKRNTVDAIE